MLVIFIRAIILYIFVFLTMRIMGKREIGQLQPFEFAITIMIADLAASPMAENGLPLINGIVPISGLLMIHLLISVLNLKSIHFRGWVCGKPSILIFRGKIDEDKLKKERITINELEEKLRTEGVSNLFDVEYAILETSGDLSVVQKPNKRAVTPEDLNIMPEYEGLPYDLVIDGKVLANNLKILGKDERWLRRELKNLKTKPENVLVATIDGKGQIFCQEKQNRRKA